MLMAYGCVMAVKARAGWAKNKLAATPAAARRINCLGLTIFKSSQSGRFRGSAGPTPNNQHSLPKVFLRTVVGYDRPAGNSPQQRSSAGATLCGENAQ
jgi:hypothetical protein